MKHLKIHHHWICNWKKKTKDEQEIKIEGSVFRADEIKANLMKHVKFLCKVNDKLKGREEEVKEILNQFIMDVYTSSNLK